jgi:cephalosporin-C deacetylase-like acetyl esterase
MAAIDWLVARPEVDPTQIVISGISFGCHWGVRAAAIDKRVRALATTYAVVGPKKAIFGEASPRFKQMFMYMAGHTDEAEFDAMAEKMARGLRREIFAHTPTWAVRPTLT